MRASKSGQTKNANPPDDRIVAWPDSSSAVDDSFDDYQESLRKLIRTIWQHPLTTQALAAAAGIELRDAQRFMSRQKKWLQGDAIWRLESHPKFAGKFLRARLAANLTLEAKETRKAHDRAAIERDELAIAERKRALEAE